MFGAAASREYSILTNCILDGKAGGVQINLRWQGFRSSSSTCLRKTLLSIAQLVGKNQIRDGSLNTRRLR